MSSSLGQLLPEFIQSMVGSGTFYPWRDEHGEAWSQSCFGNSPFMCPVLAGFLDLGTLFAFYTWSLIEIPDRLFFFFLQRNRISISQWVPVCSRLLLVSHTQGQWGRALSGTSQVRFVIPLLGMKKPQCLCANVMYLQISQPNCVMEKPHETTSGSLWCQLRTNSYCMVSRALLLNTPAVELSLGYHATV